MTFEEIQELVKKDEHRCLELKKTTGVSRMVDACKAQGVPEPEYEVNGGFVSIVFRRATEKTMDEGVNRYALIPQHFDLTLFISS